MSRINIRNKGNSGEREFCRWLEESFNVPLPTRNLEQVRFGGSDIIDVDPFYFEIKRCENLNLDAWWRQVNKAVRKACDDSLIPVVAFRQNRKAWEFLIHAQHIGVERGFLRMTETVFVRWASERIVI